MKHYFTHSVHFFDYREQSTIKDGISPLLYKIGVDDRNPLVFHGLFQYLLRMDRAGQTMEIGKGTVVELEQKTNVRKHSLDTTTYVYSLSFRASLSNDTMQIDWRTLALLRISNDLPDQLPVIYNQPSDMHRWLSLASLSEIKEVLSM